MLLSSIVPEQVIVDKSPFDDDNIRLIKQKLKKYHEKMNYDDAIDKMVKEYKLNVVNNVYRTRIDTSGGYVDFKDFYIEKALHFCGLLIEFIKHRLSEVLYIITQPRQLLSEYGIRIPNVVSDIIMNYYAKFEDFSYLYRKLPDVPRYSINFMGRIWNIKSISQRVEIFNCICDWMKLLCYMSLKAFIYDEDAKKRIHTTFEYLCNTLRFYYGTLSSYETDYFDYFAKGWLPIKQLQDNYPRNYLVMVDFDRSYNVLN